MTALVRDAMASADATIGVEGFALGALDPASEADCMLVHASHIALRIRMALRERLRLETSGTRTRGSLVVCACVCFFEEALL